MLMRYKVRAKFREITVSRTNKKCRTKSKYKLIHKYLSIFEVLYAVMTILDPSLL